MAQTRRKNLNEKELGSLYLVAETPLLIDRLMKKTDYNEGDITSIHATLAKQAPDMAIIAIALCGNMIADKLKSFDDEDIRVLGTELKHLSVNSVEEVGRIWIDTCRYGIHNEDDIHDIVHQAADILCMFSSIFMEIAEACTPQPDLYRAMTASLMYQCEAHADNARNLIENTPVKSKQKSELNDIPLPQELMNNRYTDNVVTFSLFGEQSM